MRQAPGLALVLAVLVGCGGNSAERRKERFNDEMRAWNICRSTVTWHTLTELYSLCGPIPSIPSQ
jgi:hypothetical protein